MIVCMIYIKFPSISPPFPIPFHHWGAANYTTKPPGLVSSVMLRIVSSTPEAVSKRGQKLGEFHEFHVCISSDINLSSHFYHMIHHF